jgi:hypothetical protein
MPLKSSIFINTIELGRTVFPISDAGVIVAAAAGDVAAGRGVAAQSEESIGGRRPGI